MRLTSGCLILLLASSLASTVLAQTPGDYRSDPHFKHELLEASKLSIEMGDELFAIDHYKKANKIAGGHCGDCFSEIGLLEMRRHDYKAAASTAAEWERNAESAKDKSDAEAMRGGALFLSGGKKPKPEVLAEADRELKAAAADNPKNTNVLYVDGRVLAYLNQDEEARRQFQAFIAAAPHDKLATRAAHFAADPQLARAAMAPPLRVQTLDGRYFELDNMGGKVVLIDFWATWCGPCKEELPHMKELARRYANDPFVMISVSSDADDAKWRTFVEENKMTWLQYRDRDNSASRAFEVTAIPRYFTIDSDGVLQSVKVGSGWDIDGAIKKLLVKAKATQMNLTSTEGNSR